MTSTRRAKSRATLYLADDLPVGTLLTLAPPAFHVKHTCHHVPRLIHGTNIEHAKAARGTKPGQLARAMNVPAKRGPGVTNDRG